MKDKDVKRLVAEVIREAMQEKKSNGYIYVSEMKGVYKIGQTTEPEVRIKKGDTIGPWVRNVITIKYVKGYKDIEKELHKKYKHRRMVGEWFGLTATELNEIVNFLDLISIPEPFRAKDENYLKLHKQHLYDSLPEVFAFKEGLKIAKEHNFSISTFKRFIMLEDYYSRPRHGIYNKLK